MALIAACATVPPQDAGGRAESGELQADADDRGDDDGVVAAAEASERGADALEEGPDEASRAAEGSPVGDDPRDDRADGSPGDVGERVIEGVAALVPERAPPDVERRAIEAMVARMTLAERVGQLLMPAYPTTASGAPALAIDEGLERLIRDLQPGGLVLFGDNVASAAQVRALVDSVQRVSPIPLIIAIDQEGGPVRRLRPSPELPVIDLPAALFVGRAGDSELAYELARAVALELRSLGIVMNFAPVADVLTNPAAAVIGARAYGSDPDLVARMVDATVRGYQDGGVSAVVKHFPGHGATSVDTHVGSVTLAETLDNLRTVELVPFREAIAAGVDAVMTAHIAVADVGSRPLPATFERRLVDGLLRRELGYTGVVVTDALVMAAARRVASAGEIEVLAVEAGIDLLLWPPRADRARDALIAAVTSGRISEERLNASVRRILALKMRRGLLVPYDDDAAAGDTDPTPPVRSWPAVDPIVVVRTGLEQQGALLTEAQQRDIVRRVLEGAEATRADTSATGADTSATADDPTDQAGGRR